MRMQFPSASLDPLLFPEASWVDDFLLIDKCHTSITTSHKSMTGIPSMRKPASKERISDSVELRDTDVCFLYNQLSGTNVRLPKIHWILPEVDFECSRSPAKSESSRVTHMTILSVVICVMNVRNQTSQAFVTCSCPFCDCSCKCVYGPQNGPPMRAKIQTF